MAKFIVINQMKEHRKTLINFLHVAEVNAVAAGYFEKKTMTICLNLGVLEDFIPKYQITADSQAESMLRCAESVNFIPSVAI